MKEVRLIDCVAIGMVSGFLPTFTVSFLSVNTMTALINNTLCGLGMGTFIGLMVGIFREMKIVETEN